MKANSIKEAWEIANKLFPTDYEKDESSSERAGYDIYRHPTLNYYCRICDLGDRLEVLTGEYGENVTNIWIEAQGEAQAENPTATEPKPETVLAEELEKFTRNRGWKYKTVEALKAGFDRAWKCRCDELITLDEFIAEAGDCYEEATLRDVYDALASMVGSGKLCPAEVYRYAYFGWCLRNPGAVVAYERDPGKWEVNNCGTEISKDEAKAEINREWGFEESRVEIIGTPFYDATDWQFIRFDCGHMSWLWVNESLYQVYE